MEKWIIYSIIASILSAFCFIILKVFTDNVGFLLLSFVVIGIISLIYLLDFIKLTQKKCYLILYYMLYCLFLQIY